MDRTIADGLDQSTLEDSALVRALGLERDTEHPFPQKSAVIDLYKLFPVGSPYNSQSYLDVH